MEIRAETAPASLASPPRRMKGVVAACAVRVLRKWLRAHPNAPALELSAGAQALLHQKPVLPSSWYGYDDYLELMEAIRVHALRDSLDAVADMAAAGTPIVYGGAHRVLIQEDDPSRTIRMIEPLWNTCHDFGRPTVELGENEVRVVVADALPMSELEGYINLGWIRGILEIAGAKEIREKFEARPWEGAEELHLHYRWRPDAEADAAVR